MATLFETQAGAVSVLQADDGPGLPIAIGGLGGTWYPSFKAIVTGLSVKLDGNYQFIHTLSDVIYIYTFGDRISQMRVDGLAFSGGCDGSGTGLEAILGAYATNRIANRATPIQLQVGTTAAVRFRGYLTGLGVEIVRPEARLAQFSFAFHVIPGASGPASARG